jgi:hypothetical protein
MMLDRTVPNNYTFAAAANACAILTSLREGSKIHGYAIKLGEHSILDGHDHGVRAEQPSSGGRAGV